MIARFAIPTSLLALLAAGCVQPIGPQNKDANGAACQFDVDCKDGLSCIAGYCASLDGGNSNPDGSMAGNSDAGVIDAGNFGSYCESCTQDSDCGMGGTCFTQDFSTYCTISCSSGSDCPSGAGCISSGLVVDGSSPQYCFPVSNGGKCPANSGAADGGMNMGGYLRDGGYMRGDGGYMRGDGGYPQRDGGYPGRGDGG